MFQRTVWGGVVKKKFMFTDYLTTAFTDEWYLESYKLVKDIDPDMMFCFLQYKLRVTLQEYIGEC